LALPAIAGRANPGVGVNREMLRLWVRSAEKQEASEAAGGLSMAEREELKALRVSVSRLRGPVILIDHAAEHPAEYADRDQIQQTDRHDPRSCPNPSTLPNRGSESLHRVLKRYRSRIMNLLRHEVACCE
jgi:hypothetical protein